MWVPAASCQLSSVSDSNSSGLRGEWMQQLRMSKTVIAGDIKAKYFLNE